MTSVIIPAHNEEAVIGQTLECLLASGGDRKIEIVVVCNACSDRTAEIATAAGEQVVVIETQRSGKCAAINLGEQYVSSFPRIIVDADVRVSKNFIAEIERTFEDRNAYVAWPAVHYDLSQSSWAVWAFYRTWTSLPYNQPGRIGVGAYALSDLGRAEFDQFPEIISDDGFVRGLFGAKHRRTADSCNTVVTPPRDLASLIAVRTRSRMGVVELGKKYRNCLRRHSARGELRARDFAGCIRLMVLVSAPIYLAVVLITKYRARKRISSGMQMTWDRDLTTRISL